MDKMISRFRHRRIVAGYQLIVCLLLLPMIGLLWMSLNIANTACPTATVWIVVIAATMITMMVVVVGMVLINERLLVDTEIALMNSQARRADEPRGAAINRFYGQDE